MPACGPRLARRRRAPPPPARARRSTWPSRTTSARARRRERRPSKARTPGAGASSQVPCRDRRARPRAGPAEHPRGDRRPGRAARARRRRRRAMQRRANRCCGPPGLERRATLSQDVDGDPQMIGRSGASSRWRLSWQRGRRWRTARRAPARRRAARPAAPWRAAADGAVAAVQEPDGRAPVCPSSVSRPLFQALPTCCC